MARTIDRRPVSVVMPVYNGMDTLDRSLPALLRQKDAVLGKDYEIIVVDDGSTDGSGDRVRTRYPEVRLLRHSENRGRIEARLTGIKAARFARILLIDVRAVASDDLLRTYWAMGSPAPCMGVPVEPGNHPLERVFHCLRAAYYRPYILPEDQPRLTITRENFLRAPKGTTAIFLDREDYLAALPARRDRSVSDDTRLFAAMIEKGPLLRDARLRITYLQRPTLRQELPHLFERGILFADFYLGPKGAYRRQAQAALALSVMWGLLTVASPPWGATVLAAALFGTSVALALRPLDVPYLAALLPILGCAFAAGVCKGWIIHHRPFRHLHRQRS